MISNSCYPCRIALVQVPLTAMRIRWILQKTKMVALDHFVASANQRDDATRGWESVTDMEKRGGELFERVLSNATKVTAGFAASLAFLVVIPLTLWYSWARHTTLIEPVVQTLFCFAFGWAFVSLFRWYRAMRRLELDGEGRLRLFSGSRPTEPEELRAWLLGWHFMFAVLAVLFSMMAIPLASWLTGK